MNAILYAEIYCICFIVVSILLFWMGRIGVRSYLELILSRMLICFLFAFVFNFLFTLFNSIVVVDSAMALSYIWKTLFHITIIIGVFIWCIYADTPLRSGESRHLGLRYFLLLVPAIVPIAATFVNLNTHQLFLIDEDGTYTRGLWVEYELLYLFVCSAVHSVRLLLHTRKELEPSVKFNLKVAASFPLCLLVPLLLLFIDEAYPVLCVTVTLELILLFMGATMQQVSVDTLTQVNNRQNLMGFLTQKLRNHNKELYLMMVDLDHFKVINDNYGHVEGDKALKYASSCIKTACGNFIPRPYIARYGGDEFVVVIETDKPEDTEEIAEAIRHELISYNETLPYELSLSIGVAKHQENQTPKDLIHEADQKLYDIKQERDKKK